MVNMNVNYELMVKFEADLNTRYPEENGIPTRVLGYGEVSTTLEIGPAQDASLAYKRMPMFKTEDEAVHYQRVYWDYIRVLEEQIGLHVVSSEIFHLPDPKSERWIVYLVQKKLPAKAIGNKVIRRAAVDEAQHLIQLLLRQIARAFDFNEAHGNELEVGLDGQISNWAILNFATGNPGWQEGIDFVFFDTGSPLLRKKGVEQLSPELYLRSAPSFLAWFLRVFYLDDVLNRYYEFREVAIDLLANLYKEQRADLVPPMVEVVNDFFAHDWDHGEIDPITVKEVRSYYRSDAWIWRFYLASRKVDRRLHWLLGRHYPYVLPGKTRR